jgi:hypothetical protein
MGNKKGLVWYLTIYTNDKKTEVFKIIPCDSIKEMSYYLDMKPSIISNFFHKQIKARGVLKYCDINQNI